MSGQQQPSNSPWLIGWWKPGFIIATFLADVTTASIRPFTRSDMGLRGLGAPAFWAMVLLPIYAGLAEAPGLYAYWHLWLAMVIYRRITADPIQDTRFQGFVWMFSWCTTSELSARLLEAASMPLLGAIISTFSEDIGRFLTVAGTFSFSYRYVLDALTEERRSEAAWNAVKEMEAAQRHFRRARRDR